MCSMKYMNFLNIFNQGFHLFYKETIGIAITFPQCYIFSAFSVSLRFMLRDRKQANENNDKHTKYSIHERSK